MRTARNMCAIALGWGLTFVLGPIAMGPARAQAPVVSAKVETTPLHVMQPDPYQVAAVLEPIRTLKVIAPVDGTIHTLSAQPGDSVRSGQEVAQLDRTAANLRLEIAEAEAKHARSFLAALQKGQGQVRLFTSEPGVQAAETRAKLAKWELDQRTLRAPFAGMVLDVPVCAGQFVLKGTTLVELADTSSLKAILPADRRATTVGATLKVAVEEKAAACQVKALLPLPDRFAVLHELATPFAGALVVFENPKGALVPGLRARPSGVPVSAIANVSRRAVKADAVRGGAHSMVQVIRNEYVTNVPVQVLGGIGPDRVQITGALRERDSLIVGASVALAPGTFIRFADAPASRAIEGTSPNPAHGGDEAGIVPPGGARGAATRNGRRNVGTSRSAQPPAQTQRGNNAPF